MDTAQTTRSTSSVQSTRQMLEELDALMERMLHLPVADAETPSGGIGAPPAPPATISAKLTVIEGRGGALGPASPEPEVYQERISVPFPGVLDRPNVSSPETLPPSWFDLPADKIPQDSPAADELPFGAAEEEPAAAPAAPARGESWLEMPTEPAPAAEAPGDAPAANEIAEPTVEPLTPIVTPPPSLGVTTPNVAEPSLSRRARSQFGYRPLLRINRSFDAMTRWLGPIGRVLRSPQGRGLIGITGLGLLAGAALWLVKDWMGWNW